MKKLIKGKGLKLNIGRKRTNQNETDYSNEHGSSRRTVMNVIFHLLILYRTHEKKTEHPRRIFTTKIKNPKHYLRDLTQLSRYLPISNDKNASTVA